MNKISIIGAKFEGVVTPEGYTTPTHKKFNIIDKVRIVSDNGQTNKDEYLIIDVDNNAIDLISPIELTKCRLVKSTSPLP